MSRLDPNLTPYMTELAVTWVVCGAGIIFIAPVIYTRLKDRESRPSPRGTVWRACADPCLVTAADTQELVVFADGAVAGEGDVASVTSYERKTDAHMQEA